jgi:hypothetical protein
MLLSDDREFWVPCGDCGEFQTLKWDQVRWSKAPTSQHAVYGRHQPETARYACEHCGAEWSNTQKNAYVKRGEWRSKREFRGVAGFNLNEMYSPFPGARLQDIVEKFLNARSEQKQGKDELMKAFWNNSLGLSWKADGDRPQKSAIQDRAAGYQRGAFIPIGGLLAVSASDVQGDRIETIIRVYGEREESWLFDHYVLHGDPELPHVWQQLDELLAKPIRHESGAYLRIVGSAIDSGFATQEVYNFCRLRAHRFIFPIKGVPQIGKPILGRATAQEVNYRGKAIADGVRLYPVGTDTAKKLIYGRLTKVKEPGPGCMHYPEGLHDEFFDQLVAESRIKTHTRSGKEAYAWVKPSGKRNEAFDLEVYALAAAHFAGLTRINWAERRAAIMQAGLFSQEARFAASLPAAPVEAGNERLSADVETAAALPAMLPAAIVGGVSHARRRGMRSAGIAR